MTASPCHDRARAGARLRCLAVALLVAAPVAATRAAESLAALLAASRPADTRVALENAYVRVQNTVLEYPPAPRRIAAARPVVLYLRLGPGHGFATTRLLEAPRGARPSWHPGGVPLGIQVEWLAPAPRPSALGDPATHPPRNAVAEAEGWGGGTLYVAAYRPFDYGVGLGPRPGVAIFLSDGVVEVSTNGLRRRMAVRAGYTEWFEARTRLTVVDDYAVGVAFLQAPTRQR